MNKLAISLIVLSAFVTPITFAETTSGDYSGEVIGVCTITEGLGDVTGLTATDTNGDGFGDKFSAPGSANEFSYKSNIDCDVDEIPTAATTNPEATIVTCDAPDQLPTATTGRTFGMPFTAVDADNEDNGVLLAGKYEWTCTLDISVL